jgi:hypothetical protein
MMTEIKTPINPDPVFRDLNLGRHRVGKGHRISDLQNFRVKPYRGPYLGCLDFCLLARRDDVDGNGSSVVE